MSIEICLPTVELTTWKNVKNPRGRRVMRAWEDMFKWWLTLPELKEDVAKMDLRGWSPATFKENKRSLENVETICAIVLDVDKGAGFISDAIEAFGAYDGVVVSSYSHTAEANAFRVVLPLRRSVSVSEYDRLWTWAAGLLGDAGVQVDGSTKDASRLWFMPVNRPGHKYECVRLAGFRWVHPDVILADLPEEKPALPAPPVPKPSSTPNGVDYFDRAVAYLEQCDPAISGSAGHNTTLRVTSALVNGFELNDWDVKQLLKRYSARCKPPWTDSELLHKIESARKLGPPDGKPMGWLRDAGESRAISRGTSSCTPPSSISSRPADPDPEREAIRAEAAPTKFFRCTDYGNAERLLHHHGRDLRHVADIGWHAWTGNHWEIDRTGEVFRRAKQTARAIYKEAASATDPNMRKAIADWAKSSESSGKVDAMVKLARSEAQIAITSDSLDQNHYLLNVENGTLDLHTGKLRAHDPRDLITRWVNVPYVETAECPRWLAFLDRVLGGDAELITFVQNWFGYCLTGDVSEQALVFFYGSGANGKSTLLTVLLDLLGGYVGYARSAAPDLLLAKHNKGSDHPCDVADLRGARLVICQEIENGKAFAESVVKQLTGGDRVKARFMKKDFFEFFPTHKLVIAANHKPIVKGTDYAIWRRIRLVPFDVTISDDEKDPQLVDKLRTELPGILRWCVEGCLAWRRDGLGEPAVVKQATAGYRAEMDVVGTFIDESCFVDQVGSVQASQLYAAYVAWAELHGERPISQRAFGASLRERGFESKKNNTIWWHGIGLFTGRTGRTGSESTLAATSLGPRVAKVDLAPDGPVAPVDDAPRWS